MLIIYKAFINTKKEVQTHYRSIGRTTNIIKFLIYLNIIKYELNAFEIKRRTFKVFQINQAKSKAMTNHVREPIRRNLGQLISFQNKEKKEI